LELAALKRNRWRGIVEPSSTYTSAEQPLEGSCPFKKKRRENGAFSPWISNQERLLIVLILAGLWWKSQQSSTSQPDVACVVLIRIVTPCVVVLRFVRHGGCLVSLASDGIRMTEGGR
jgi:hypothetical protein